MSLRGKYALITGSSRGIGRAIALKLAECGAKIGVHYYKNIDAANDTLAKVRERRSDGFIVQADVNRTDDIRGMMDHVKSEFRSEEHTSELQSRRDLVCRLLLEKKK